jgi:hypothetical protein
VVTFMIVFAARYTSEKTPGTRVEVMSPTVTGTADAPGLSRSTATMCGDNSIPETGTPRALSGSATRPVPAANSSADPYPASEASTSTQGPSTAGSNMPE